MWVITVHIIFWLVLLNADVYQANDEVVPSEDGSSYEWVATKAGSLSQKTFLGFLGREA